MSTPRSTIDRVLAGYVRRRRIVAAARGIFWAVAAVTGWCLLACVGDRFLAFVRPVRFGVLLTAAAAAVVLLRPVTALFRRRFDPVAAACEIERACPDLSGRLATAVSKPVGGTSVEMLDAVTAAAAAQLPRRIAVPVRPLLIPTLALVVVAAAVVAAVRSPRLQIRDLAVRLVHPLRVLPPVTATHLTVVPTPPSVPVGQPLKVVCTAAPVDPATVILHVSDDAGRTWGAWPMVPDPGVAGKFSYTWAAVNSGLRFNVTAGDAVGPTTTVEASAKPVITDVRIRVEPPPYLHRPVVNLTGTDAAVDAVDGSVVTMDAMSSRPLWRLRVSANGRDTEIAPAADPAIARYSFTATGDQRLVLRAIGADGQTSDDRMVQIHVQQDHPPTVHFIDPVEVILVGRDSRVDAGFDAADDFGLVSVFTDVRVNDRRTPGVLKTFDANRLSATVENTVDLKPLAVTVGDVVSIRLRARDSHDQYTMSEVHDLLVVPNPPDPRAARRLADLACAIDWLDRAGTDPAAVEQVRVCLERAAADSPSARKAGFLMRMTTRPISSIRADVQTLLNAERAAELDRLRAALDWIDSGPEAARKRDAYRAVRERLVGRTTAEASRLGVNLSNSGAADRLGEFEEAADVLVLSDAGSATIPIPGTPAIKAPRPPAVPAVSRQARDAEVPGYEDALKVYFDRLKGTPGK